MSGELIVGLCGSVAIVVAALIGWFGVRATIKASRAASDATTNQQAQAQALEAWQELVAPYREEVRTVRRELDQERLARATDTDETRAQIARQAEQIEHLRQEVQTWKRMARTIARWATTLRDQVLQLGGTVPATPKELLTLQDLDGVGEEPDTEL